jgi:hypothetical protein
LLSDLHIPPGQTSIIFPVSAFAIPVHETGKRIPCGQCDQTNAVSVIRSAVSFAAKMRAQKTQITI